MINFFLFMSFVSAIQRFIRRPLKVAVCIKLWHFTICVLCIWKVCFTNGVFPFSSSPFYVSFHHLLLHLFFFNSILRFELESPSCHCWWPSITHPRIFRTNYAAYFARSSPSFLLRSHPHKHSVAIIYFYKFLFTNTSLMEYLSR